jgi:hypothetical protein
MDFARSCFRGAIFLFGCGMSFVTPRQPAMLQGANSLAMFDYDIRASAFRAVAKENRFPLFKDHA